MNRIRLDWLELFECQDSIRQYSRERILLLKTPRMSLKDSDMKEQIKNDRPFVGIQDLEKNGYRRLPTIDFKWLELVNHRM
jgi:hypothetical protein